MRVFDDGSGSAIFAAGLYTEAPQEHSGLWRWDGARWERLDDTYREFEMSRRTALTIHDDGSGAALYVGGEIFEINDRRMAGISRWDGASFSRLASEGLGIPGGVVTFAVRDDGQRQTLFVGGDFDAIVDGTVANVTRFEGDGWNGFTPAVATVLDESWPIVELVAFEEEDGPIVLAAAGTNAENEGLVHQWDGTSWSPFAVVTRESCCLQPRVEAFVRFDDGVGEQLYVGGQFDRIDGVVATSLARWDGASWAAVATPPVGRPEISALAVFDDGHGARLHAVVDGGSLWRWDGAASWTLLGEVTGRIDALEVFDDGSGLSLFVGGDFREVLGSQVAGVSANNIARFDGRAWSGLANGVGNSSSNSLVRDLEVFDDGRGAALYASGFFLREMPGGQVLNHLGRWDGESWAPLGNPVAPDTVTIREMTALQAWNDTLYVGGTFSIVDGQPSRSIAAWSCGSRLLFADGFESGDTSAWSTTIP